MKLYVVRVPDDLMMWDQPNEAVIRAETPERARELLLAAWDLEYDPTELTWMDLHRIQVAEINQDGPEGILSVTDVDDVAATDVTVSYDTVRGQHAVVLESFSDRVGTKFTVHGSLTQLRGVVYGMDRLLDDLEADEADDEADRGQS